MHLVSHLVAPIAVMSAGLVYGTDAFCALGQRPVLASVDDQTLTAVMGNVYRFGDPEDARPGILGIIATAAPTVLAALPGEPRHSHRGGSTPTAVCLAAVLAPHL
jgi:hypothetical protein